MGSVGTLGGQQKAVGGELEEKAAFPSPPTVGKTLLCTYSHRMFC